MTDAGRRTPDRWTRTVGDLRLTYLPDGDIEGVPTAFFPSTTQADWDARPDLVRDDGHFVAGAGALLVERGDDRFVVDAGLGPVTIGPDDSPPLFGTLRGGDLPASCTAAGLDPATVDLVLLTHLHLDHVGWATPSCCEDGRSLFPAATWAVGVGETVGPHREEHLALAGEAERTREVADGEEVRPGVRAWSLPGHTPGHTAWVIDAGSTQHADRGQRVIAFGDAMHSPAQVEHPEWAVAVDGDGETAGRSRRALLDALAGDDVLGFGVHFADRQLGRVVDGRWVAVD